MGQVLHGSATTTEAVRHAIRHSQESLRALARRYSVNPKTVAKWKKRMAIGDLPTGPKGARSTTLSIEQEAVIVGIRRYRLLPLDDCLCVLQAMIPKLTRSSLHRCLQRHGISRLPEAARDTEPQPRSKTHSIGYFRIDVAEVRTAGAKLHLYVAIDRISRLSFAQLVPRTDATSASAFLAALIAAVPYKIHTVLTGNGVQFACTPRHGGGPAAGHITPLFDMRCRENAIEHCLTGTRQPWSNCQVERMNRTISEAIVKRCHHDNHQQLETHLHAFIDAYNHGPRLKVLKGLTPFDYICGNWITDPQRFTFDPVHRIPRPNR